MSLIFKLCGFLPIKKKNTMFQKDLILMKYFKIRDSLFSEVRPCGSTVPTYMNITDFPIFLSLSETIFAYKLCATMTVCTQRLNYEKRSQYEPADSSLVRNSHFL